MPCLASKHVSKCRGYTALQYSTVQCSTVQFRAVMPGSFIDLQQVETSYIVQAAGRVLGGKKYQLHF